MNKLLRTRYMGVIGLVGLASVPFAALPSQAEPVMGGDMTISWLAPNSRLDNALMNSLSIIDFPIMTAIYGQLVYRTPDDRIEPLLAKSLTSNEDFTSWTLTLREGLKFSDGTPLDAEAVVFNLDRFNDPATKSPRAGNLKGITYAADGPLSVTFTLPESNFLWDRDFATYFSFMGSPTALKANPESFATDPIGAGPFVLESWKQGDSIEFVRNPHYLEDRKPYLDKLTLKVIRDPQQALQSVISGTTDGAFAIEPDVIASALAEDGLNIVQTTSGGGNYFEPNTSRPPFDDERARKAIQLAMNAQFVLDAARGAGEAADNIFSPDSRWYAEGAASPASDPEKAQALLDELAAEGKPLSFSIMTNIPLRDYAEALQATLLAYDNITVSLDPVDNATRTTRARSGDFEMITNGAAWESPYPRIDQTFKTGGTLNYASYSNPTVDEALARRAKATTEEEAAKEYAIVQEAVVQDAKMLMVSHWSLTYIFDEDVTGIEPVGTGASLIWDRLAFDK